MKKIYLFIFIVLICLTGFSQNTVLISTPTALPAPAGANLPVSFTSGVTSPAGPGILTVYYQGDFDGTGGNLENADIFDENANLLGFTPPSTGQCFAGLDSVKFTISVSDLASWAADQIISFDFTPTALVNPTLCAAQDITFRLEYPPVTGPNDAAVFRVDSPDVFCPSPQNVYATIGNSGTNQINSVDVHWEIDGVPQTVISYSSLLDTLGGANPTSATILLGNVTFGVNPVDIKVYTANPNGVADMNNLNDTSSVTKQASLNGALTIDPGLPASGVNYTSFSSLATALNTFGICGPTYVTVAPGTYTEVFSISNVVGLGAVNTLTIDGLDSAMVTLTNSFTASGALIDFRGISYTTVKNMTLIANTSGTFDHFAVHLMDGSNYDSLQNLHILMDPTNAIGAVGIGASAAITSNLTEGDNANYTTTMNCNIEGGEDAVHFEGGVAGSWNAGNKFVNVTTSNMDDYGFYFDEQDSLEVIGCSVSGNRAIGGDGIFGLDCMNFIIQRNNVHVPDWGIHFADANSDRSPERPAEISNNMVISDADYGIYLIDALRINVWNNSSHADGTTEAFRVFGTATDSLDIRNNIFSATTAIAFETAEPDSIFLKLENNVYNTGGADLLDIDGTLYADLVAYQTVQPLLNTASLEGDPSFASPTDLHIVGTFVNDMGDNSVPVFIDIDGDTRPISGATFKDPGADEFNPPLCPPVNGISVTDIASDSVTIFWTGGGNSYQYNLVSTGSPIGGGILAITPSDSSRVGGLMPSTLYDLYVREVCGRADTSQWLGPISFFTPCVAPSAVVLPYFEGFETINGTVVGDGIIKCDNVANINFETDNQGFGRVRFGTDAITTISGNGAMTMDVTIDNNNSVNSGIFTIDMSTYSTSTGLELAFDYMDHGDETTAGDNVWVRGSSSDSWVVLFDLTPGTTTNGAVNNAGPLDIDAAIAGAGQTITSTFQVRFGQADNFAATSATGTDGITFDNIAITELASDDAGIVNLVSPEVLCPGTVTPIVEVRNFGINDINSVSVVIEVNGTAVDTVLYNTTIQANSSANVTMNGIPVNSGITYDVKFYTINPNGNIDQQLSNDTLTLNGLVTGVGGGTYTIDSFVATGGTNFQSFTDFVTTVNTFGVCGPIVVDVVSGSGPYNEQVLFDEVQGTNSTNTIVINGNGETINFGSITTGQRAVITIQNSSWITIDSLTVDATGGTFGWGIHMLEAADNINILNSTINSNPSTTSLNFQGIVASGTATSATTSGVFSDIIIDNNTVTGGDHSISFLGSAANRSTDVQITNNTVIDHGNYGMYLSEMDIALVEGNDISRPTSTAAGTSYGIALLGSSQNCVINANAIHNTNDGNTASTSDYIGIWLGGDAAAGNPNIVSNNLIYNINGSGDLYGIYDTGADGANYYHNTISMDDVNSTATLTTRAFYQTAASSNSQFVNNIISVTRGGSGIKHGIYLQNATSTIFTDYNDVYMNSAGTGVQNYGRFGTADEATLLDWQTNTAFGQNSFDVDPRFFDIAGDNYVPRSGVLNDAGFVTGFVIEDFFGVIRSGTPDPGAIEFTPSLANNALLSALVNPSFSSDSCYGGNEDVTITVRNFGGAPVDFTVDNMAVVVNVSGGTTNALSLTINDNSLNGGNPLAIGDEINIPMGTIDMTTIGSYDFNSYITLVGDTFPNNDTLLSNVTLLPYSGGTIEGSDSICLGDTAFLSTSNFVGQLQWQVFDGTNWIDIMGETGTDISVAPMTLTDYRVLACGIGTSDTITVTPINLAVAPIAQGDTTIVICGTLGTAIATASATNPNALFNWFTSATGTDVVDTSGSVFGLNAGGDSLSYNVSNTVNGAASVDTLWVAEVSASSGGDNTLKITEVDLGGTDALEIQNVSSSAIDVTGWSVAVSDDYTLINDVNATVQILSGVLAPNDILTWSDAAAAANYWGSNLFWNPASPGWVIILDAQGNTVDYMAFEWSATDLLTQSLTIGAFTGVTPGVSGDWIGDGIAGAAASAGNSLYRIGMDDNDDLNDWSIQPVDIGVQNTGLTTPFPGGACESPRTMVIVMVDCLVGLDNLSTETATLRISPNPSNGLFTLNIDTPQQENFNLTVRDLSGKVVFEDNVNVNGQYRDDLDFTGFAKGVYYMQVQTGNESKVEKLIIQ